MDNLKTALRLEGDICDCAVLWKERQTIAAIELKGGKANVNVAKAVRQLQQGLNLLNKLLVDQPVGEFFPILLYDANRDPTRALAGKLVEFRGEKRRIMAEPCGIRLAQIIKNLSRARKKRRFP